MNVISDINTYDFFFNGHFLSEFGGYVGSTDGGLKKYPFLPSREYATDSPLEYDGEYVFDSHLAPREWEVPIVFDNIDDAGLRQVAGWLDTSTAAKFYYADDTVYIMACLNGDNNDISSVSGKDGEITLNFIAHDPFYYAINPSTYTFTNIMQDTKSHANIYNMINAGTKTAFPTISVMATHSFVLNVLDSTQTQVASLIVDLDDVTTGSTQFGKLPIVIESRYCTCTCGDYNLYGCVKSKFPLLPVGVFYFSFSPYKDDEGVTHPFDVKSFTCSFHSRYV